MTIEYVIKYLYTKIMWVLPIIMPNSCLLIISVYTKSLVNTNFTNTYFQKVSIPDLTRTMKQIFLH